VRMLNVSEIFGPTMQGEGTNIGKLCYFVRLSGCDSNCLWCDTNSIKTVFTMPVSKIVLRLKQQAAESHIKHIVITGGNPLLQPNTRKLCQKLLSNHFTVEIETQGTIYMDLPSDVHLNISPKGPSAGNVDTMKTGAHFMKLIESHSHDLKFVLDGGEEDLAFMQGILEIEQHLCSKDNLKRIIIQPVNGMHEVNVTIYRKIIEQAIALNLKENYKSRVRTLTQLHKIAGVE